MIARKNEFLVHIILVTGCQEKTLRDPTCVKNGVAPESIQNLFVTSDNQDYSLRGNLINFRLDKPKRNFMKKSISYSGAKCWNDLPTDLKSNTLTMNQFRAILEGAELI